MQSSDLISSTSWYLAVLVLGKALLFTGCVITRGWKIRDAVDSSFRMDLMERITRTPELFVDWTCMESECSTLLDSSQGWISMLLA
mmetsp:Transcript_41493/g.111084  ORF Transcript_41493/g.111084 Transcript_41493/m.111084 type:complete len:86 (-) Transcript_41493:1137-1394(-)